MFQVFVSTTNQRGAIRSVLLDEIKSIEGLDACLKFWGECVKPSPLLPEIAIGLACLIPESTQLQCDRDIEKFGLSCS
jgi:hypothetical protein